MKKQQVDKFINEEVTISFDRQAKNGLANTRHTGILKKIDSTYYKLDNNIAHFTACRISSIKPGPEEPSERTCAWCNKNFKITRYGVKQRFCSAGCTRLSYNYERKKDRLIKSREQLKAERKEKMENYRYKCSVCGKKIYSKKQYCSQKCENEYIRRQQKLLSNICKAANREHVSYGVFIAKYGLHDKNEQETRAFLMKHSSKLLMEVET